MMKSPKNLLIFSVIGAVVGIGIGLTAAKIGSSNGFKAEAFDEASDLISVIMTQQEAWNEGDIEAFMQGYAKNEDLRFASGGDITSGWNETLSRYRTRYTDRSAMGELGFDIVNASVLGENDGLIFGRWTLTRETDKPTGLFTLHMKKIDGQWLIVSDHTSSAN